jgi:hypothetical protein
MDSAVNDGHLKLPKQTTPTWEMELLISGASVFALLQLPAALNSVFLDWQIRIHDHYLNALIFPLFLYVKVAVVCLAATFLLHLASRAYWVGLIGLNSIFPGGPKLEHMKYGPLFSAHMRRTMNSAPEQLIERADNRATMIFGFGVGLALVMLIPTVLVGAAALAAWLLSPLLGSEAALWGVIGFFAAPLMLIATLPTLLDKTFGTRIAADSLSGKAITGSFNFLRRIQMDGTGNILIMYLYGQTKSFGKAMLAFMAGGMLLGSLSMTDVPRLYSVRSQSDVVNEMEAADYTSERGGNREYAMRASIPAVRVSGAWLDVTVPVPTRQPSNDLPNCQDDNRKAIAECLSKQMRISVDGTALAVDWQMQRASEDRPQALRTMLDVSNIARGKHALTIDYLPNRKMPNDAWQERIVFWN